MTLCQHRLLDDPDGTPCTSDEHPQNPGGHTYGDRFVADRHTASEDAAEVRRG